MELSQTQSTSTNTRTHIG